MLAHSYCRPHYQIVRFTYLIKGNNVGDFLFFFDHLLINPFYYVFNEFL